MKPEALIESYVAEVVRYLPRRLRDDVGFELRSLLTEELRGRAGDGEPDTATTLALLADFGRPAEVADRYRPAGFTIIRPADAPRFAWIALGGVAIQWVITLIATYTAPATGAGDDWLSRLGTWWLSAGLGAFWWPGLLVSLSIVAAVITARRGTDASEWTPRAAAGLDRDRISRPLYVLAIAGALVGIAALVAAINLATWWPWLPQPVLDAFVIDETFLTTRAPWALVLWAAAFASMIAVLIAGRWTRTTRLLSIVGNVLWIVLLVWWVAAGPIFVQPAADSVTKGCLILIAAICVLDLVITARHLRRGIPEPAV
ncbi:hypothetical protein [Agromyces aureus]|uniref:Uncharacterized protein n=1 Tax=Agromyces aureus TaxID=453304 RepID=A0A191WCR9_9MICO|nr:hypothetical protein [Agromyces aureus]ANJ25988.1 hypothetical protein ATC03_03805 [Agromyces aureus]